MNAKPGESDINITCHPTDSWTLFPCLSCHDTTLQHHRLPSVTKWRRARILRSLSTKQSAAKQGTSA